MHSAISPESPDVSRSDDLSWEAVRVVASHDLDSRIQFRDLEDIFLAYSRTGSLTLAMFRAAELHHLRTWAVRRPVLDLGCGDGLFAANCLNGRLDVGLDCSPSRLARARAVGGHLSLVQADAGEMPFPQWENTWSFRSRHPGGIQFAFADGSTRFVNDSISLAVYRTLATMNGGEVGTFY